MERGTTREKRENETIAYGNGKRNEMRKERK